MNEEQALIEACMLTGAVSPDADPRKVISDLIMWHVQMDRDLYREDMNFRSAPIVVCIKRSQIGEREVDQVRVFMSDMWFSTDLVDDRQIRLAKKLATDNAILFHYDEANAERCRIALGEQP